MARIRIALLAVVVVLAGCSGGKAAKPQATTTTLPTLTGTLNLDGGTVDPVTGPDNFIVVGGSCSGTGGYDDLKEGAAVTVTNEAGTVIANSQLDAGHESSAECVFTFNVPQVPAAKFYGIEVSHRGKVTYSAGQLANNQWSVELTIGS